MKKVTLIIGQGPCGKTTMLKELTRDFKTAFILGKDLNSTLNIPVDTEIIAIDELAPGSQYSDFKHLIRSNEILINPKHLPVQKIKRPQVIAATNYPLNTEDFFKHDYIEIINLDKKF